MAPYGKQKQNRTPHPYFLACLNNQSLQPFLDKAVSSRTIPNGLQCISKVCWNWRIPLWNFQVSNQNLSEECKTYTDTKQADSRSLNQKLQHNSGQPQVKRSRRLPGRAAWLWTISSTLLSLVKLCSRHSAPLCARRNFQVSKSYLLLASFHLIIH